jgi:type II secretory pathway pseudopilin PulG
MLKIKSFSLVEIIVVVVILVLLSALSIPNLLRARINSNEASAIGSMRTISDAAQSYKIVNGVFPANLASLGPGVAGAGGRGIGSFYCAAIAQPHYLDATLGCAEAADGVKTCKKQGYAFWLTGTTNTFIALGVPQKWKITGTRTFFVDESGVIRYTRERPAGTLPGGISKDNTLLLE